MTTVSDNGEDPTPELALSAEALRAAQVAQSLDPRTFHHAHTSMIRGIIAKRVSDRQAVDDICQKTWASFFNSDGLTADDPVAFLVSIARCRVADHYRRAAARETCAGEVALSRRQDELLRDRLTHQLSDDAITKVDLERALAELSPKHRLLLELHYVDDLAPETIARMLRVSRATFYTMRGDAFIQLRKSPHLTSYHPITGQEAGQ